MTSATQPDRIADIQNLGNPWLAEVAQLRDVKVPGVSAQPPEVHEALLTARGGLDRVEEILAMAMVLRSGAEARAKDLTEKADDALDKALVAHSKRAREFEGARERLAAASLDTLPERSAARTAVKVADLAAGIEKRVRLHYYGLVKLRDELSERLRHLAWEANNDR